MSTIIPMQNLYSTKKNGKQVWVVGFTNHITKKRERKFFASKSDAISYRASKLEARKLELSWLTDLNPDSLQDIKNALSILPKGKTLTESVKRAWESASDISIDSMIFAFKQMKEAKNATGKLSDKEFSNIKARLKDFNETFKTFADCTPATLLDYLKSKGRNKTVQNWRGTINEFLNFCVSQDAIQKNPIARIHKDALLKVEEAYKVECATTSQTREFMRMLEKLYPKYVPYFALALFAGVRIAEIPRMKLEYFRFKERQIVFPAQIGKIKKSWLLENLPENLWKWLEKYPPITLKPPYSDLHAKWTKEFKLPPNFARHSFATYHISLYFDFAKTSKITRNSEQMLKNHDFDKLVPQKTAQEYFNIIPET